MRRVCRLLLICLPLLGCERGEKPAAVGPAESELRRSGEVRLSPSAQQAIGLRTAVVTRRKIGESLSATGWLMPIPGHEVIVKSPTAGFVTAVENGEAFPVLGNEVAAAKPLASLQVFVSPQEQAQLVAAKEDADAAIAQADVTMRLIGNQLERYRTAKESITGSRLVELQEMYDKAQAAYREAKEKLPYLPTEPYQTPFGLKPIDVPSPLGGRITAVHVAPKQFVSAGDPLWTIADWGKLWVRVPVFEADVKKVRVAEPAQIALADERGTTLAAAPVKAPQTVDPTRRTLDLYFLIDNASGALRSGQTVAATLPIEGVVEKTIVPLTAVLWDEQGATWVYVRSGKDEFRRQKIELGRRIGDDVIVQRGLDATPEVVVAGAQALYGEEFKSGIPVDDDD